MADYISSLTGQQMDSALTDMAQHNSEAYAVGKRNGADVPSTDITYHNNSKYYSDVARQISAGLKIQVVESLPAIGQNGIIYLVLVSGTTYRQYVWDFDTQQYIDLGTTTGAGDMTKAVYDSTNAVANAGGIVPYVDSNGGKIDHIQVNGTEQTITNKTVNLAVDSTPTSGSNNPVQSGGVKDALDTLDNEKQDNLTFDSTPTAGSNNPVKSSGIYNSLQTKQSILSTAGHHNSIVRGADITQYFTDGTLWKRINGTDGFEPFEDLYLGDYINMGVRVTCQESDQGTSYGNIGSQYVTIAGFNTHLRNGDQDLNYNHLCMVAGQFKSGDFHFGRHRMNASNVTTGGYAGSVMHTSVLGAVASSGKSYADGGTINEQLYNIFGSHLKTTRELLSNAVNNSGYNRLGANSGCSNGWAWASCQAVLMSEVECYGSIVWSSSGYDTGNANNQLPLFRLEKGCMNNRSSYYWLKDVVSASWFALCDDGGNATYADASNAYRYVRPRFLIS